MSWRRSIHEISSNGINLKIKHLLLALVAILALSVPSAQAQLSRLKFGKYRITSIVPSSFRSVRGSVEVTVTNDTTSFLMKDITGIIYRNGEPFVEGVCSDVRVVKGTSTVEPVGTVRICEGVSVWSVLRCMVDLNIEEFTGDLSMTLIDAKGHTRPLKKEGVSVAEVLKNRKRKNN